MIPATRRIVAVACVALLIASEFMPVSLLTPIAADLKATEGMAGQAISISGLFLFKTPIFPLVTLLNSRPKFGGVLTGIREDPRDRPPRTGMARA